MPALIKTEHQATVVWLGNVPDRAAGLRSVSRQSMTLTFAGPEGEDHGGLTRPSCSRVTTQYPKDTTIRNTRQLSVVSQEELDAIASDMGLDALNPAWVGATLVLKGIPDFTHLPPSARLQTQTGTTLTVDMENHPCTLPAPVIDADAPGYGRAFKAAAKDRRGVTAWVEREGIIALGDTVTLHNPAQRAWQSA